MERPLHKHFAKSCKNNKTEENVNIKRKKKRHHFVNQGWHEKRGIVVITEKNFLTPKEGNSEVKLLSLGVKKFFSVMTTIPLFSCQPWFTK